MQQSRSTQDIRNNRWRRLALRRTYQVDVGETHVFYVCGRHVPVISVQRLEPHGRLVEIRRVVDVVPQNTLEDVGGSVGNMSENLLRGASKSKKRPPTSIIPGDDARRWREGTPRSYPLDRPLPRLLRVVVLIQWEPPHFVQRGRPGLPALEDVRF